MDFLYFVRKVRKMGPKKDKKEKSSEKKTRGPTTQKMLVEMRARGERLPVAFTRDGKAKGENRAIFNSNLGRSVRSHIPCICREADMTNEQLTEIWADIMVC